MSTESTTDPITKEVNVAELVEPKFLSLVGLPANQIAFKVVRKDGEARIARKKRGETKVLSLVFPEGATATEMAEYLTTYGFEDFEIDAEPRTVYRRGVQRSDTTITTMSVLLPGNVKALIQRSDVCKDNVTLVALEFALDYYPAPDEIIDWCKRNSLDISEERFETADVVTIAKRHDLPAGVEVRRMQLDDGVVAVIARTEEQDVPAPFVQAIAETAYGHWGWGQLDFGAMLADVAFCNAAESANHYVRTLLDRIVFDSALPVAQRKELVANAAAQYAVYIGSLLDALPSQVVNATRSFKEKQMSEQTQASEVKADEAQAEPVQVERQDDTPAEQVTEQVAEVVAEQNTPEFVTRSELDAAVTRAVTQAVTDALAAVQRKDEPAKAEGATQADPLADVLRAVSEIGQKQSAIVERLDAFESRTVVRSDSQDGKQSKPADPFKGMFGARV